MQIIHDRRALHRIPELELTLPKTMAYLRSRLAGLNCALFSPTPEPPDCEKKRRVVYLP